MRMRSPIYTRLNVGLLGFIITSAFSWFFYGAGGGGRTHTILLSRDFESRASANSATPANGNLAKKMVWMTGLEPARFHPHGPQPCASTNSATSTRHFTIIDTFHCKCKAEMKDFFFFSSFPVFRRPDRTMTAPFLQRSQGLPSYRYCI